MLSKKSRGRASQGVLYNGGSLFCGARDVGVRPQKRNNSPRFKKKDGSVRCRGAGRALTSSGWCGSVRQNARPTRYVPKLNLPALWHRALAAMHGWAGHMARKKEMHPGAAAISYKNVEWWEIMKSAGIGAHDQSWRHPKKNWVRGFEHALSTVLGLGWWGETKNVVAKAGREKNCFRWRSRAALGRT